MPILMPSDTGAVLGANAKYCDSRSLLLDRFGLPYIPGSAVKGCARRAALAALREWCENGQKPGITEEDEDNLFKDACADFSTPAAMLAAIARVFGWGEQDWKTRDDFRNDEEWLKKRSDFAWACEPDSGAERLPSAAPTGRSIPAQGNALGARPDTGPSPEGAAQTRAVGWGANRTEVMRTLGITRHEPSASEPETRGEGAPANGRGARVPRIKDFAGSVSFLPASPLDLPAAAQIGDLPVPPLGKLELDVVTCHHRDYYARKLPVATDTEEPVPVVFPAVAAGHVFAFALRSLPGAEPNSAVHARAWLKTGLEIFGLGAKTNAGYGWFEDVTDAIQAAETAEKARQAERVRQAQEKAATENMRASLQPDAALIEKLRAMKEADLRGQINPFATEERFWSQNDERVQLTLLHFLTVAAPALLAADRANPKSKLAKALASLSAKFPHVASPKP